MTTISASPLASLSPPSRRQPDVRRASSRSRSPFVGRHRPVILADEIVHCLGVVDLAGRDARGVNEAASRIHPDVGLQPGIPLLALLRLAHLGIALAILVLSRRRGGDQHRIQDGSATQQRPLVFEVSADGLENRLCEIMRFIQMTEVEDRRLVGGRVNSSPAKARID